MDLNPYKAPAAGIEPAQPRPISAAAKRGAWIGAIIMFSLSGISGAIIVVMSVVNSVAIRPGDLAGALAVMLVYALAGSAVGAAIGALFRAIVNALTTTEKPPPAN